MRVGERIKKIRIFRGITQRDLGIKMGYEEKFADTRIAQYESGYRVPKKDAIIQLAQILDVNYIMLLDYELGSAENLMQILFWLDEMHPEMIKLVELERDSKKYNSTETINVRYTDSDYWPPKSPIGIWFDYSLIDEFLHEWVKRKHELESGEITRKEYFEWKLNWPYTCDDNKAPKPWRHS